MFVGHAGGGGQFIYGIVGDIANTASRIEQLNKQLGTRLLATEEVVAGPDDILVRPLGDFWLAGKRSSVPVVEVLCPVRGVTMAQLSLCARFELAVEAFRGLRWAEAESYFQSIDRDYPNDGPARFYLDQRLPEARRLAAETGSSPGHITQFSHTTRPGRCLRRHGVERVIPARKINPAMAYSFFLRYICQQL